MIDLDEAVRFQVRKAERRIAERERRRKELVERAGEVARLLHERYGAKRVWVFGSLLHEWFHEGSDIDMAVEGLDAEQLGRAHDEAIERAGTRVDLVRMEEADPRLRQRILDTGRVVP